MVRNLLRFVLVAALSALMAPALAPWLGEFAAIVADRPDRAVPALGMRVEARAAPGVTVAPGGSGRSVTLQADGRGHFEAEALINRMRVAALIDTGATSVVLRAEDAARIGIRPFPNDFTVPIATANGAAKAARVILDEVRIGQVKVRQVEALVMPARALSTSLIGMAFLKRLGRVEMKDERLVLSE